MSMEITDFDVKVRINKKADDAAGIVRVSLGGMHATREWYCVYRGTKEQAIQCLEDALTAMRAMSADLGPDREPDRVPDDGKRYA